MTQKQQEDEKKVLRRERPDLVGVYERENAEAEFLRRLLTTGQYAGMDTGNPDVYKAFNWRFWDLLANGSGWAGIVLPRSALCAKGSTEFRKRAFAEAQFADVTWLTNNQKWVFEDVHPQYTIALTSYSKRATDRDQAIPLSGPFRSAARYDEGRK